MELPDTPTLLASPCTSFWLRDALTSALSRDPVDALNDAEILVAVLNRHLQQLAGGHLQSDSARGN